MIHLVMKNVHKSGKKENGREKEIKWKMKYN